MYWVVLACALLVESWTEWFLVWYASFSNCLLTKHKYATNSNICNCRIPLYPYVRLLFLLYLVLPQTQGARIIYTTYVHPYLEDNESQIEDLIATAHDKMKAAGMAYLKQAIEILRTQVLGMAPSPEAAQAESNNIPASDRPRSYTQALLDRFQLPAARWLPAGTNAAVGADFYNFLANAVTAATGAAGTGADNKEGSSGNNMGASSGASAAAVHGGVGAFPAGDMTASGTLVPPSIRDNADKMTFLAAQRERLNMVLSALDREAAQLRSSSATSPSVVAQDDNLDLLTITSSSNDRPTTSASAKSGLSKSRSEADFEKIDAESGAEDDAETARPEPNRSGSWIPWGWGSAARDEKSKDE